MYLYSFFFLKPRGWGGVGLPVRIVFLKTGKVQREICFYAEMSLYDFCVNAPWNVVLQCSFKVSEGVNF